MSEKRKETWRITAFVLALVAVTYFVGFIHSGRAVDYLICRDLVVREAEEAAKVMSDQEVVRDHIQPLLLFGDAATFDEMDALYREAYNLFMDDRDSWRAQTATRRLCHLAGAWRERVRAIPLPDDPELCTARVDLRETGRQLGGVCSKLTVALETGLSHYASEAAGKMHYARVSYGNALAAYAMYIGKDK